MFACKNAHGHRDIERGHLFLDGLQFRGLSHPVQLVEDERLLMCLKVLNNGVVPPQKQTSVGNVRSWGRVVLRKSVVVWEEDKHFVSRNCARDRLCKTSQQI